MSDSEKLEYIHLTLTSVGDGPASFEMVSQAIKFVEQLMTTNEGA